MHEMLSQKFAEMQAAFGEQMRSAFSDALEKKVADVANFFSNLFPANQSITIFFF